LPSVARGKLKSYTPKATMKKGGDEKCLWRNTRFYTLKMQMCNGLFVVDNPATLTPPVIADQLIVNQFCLYVDPVASESEMLLCVFLEFRFSACEEGAAAAQGAEAEQIGAT
jgi:hypothetical protein